MLKYPWTDAEEASLRELHAKGLTQRQIAITMARTPDSIARKMRQLQLVHRIGRPSAPVSGPDGRFVPRTQRPLTPQRAGLVTLPPLPSLQDVD